MLPWLGTTMRQVPLGRGFRPVQPRRWHGRSRWTLRGFCQSATAWRDCPMRDQPRGDNRSRLRAVSALERHHHSRPLTGPIAPLEVQRRSSPTLGCPRRRGERKVQQLRHRHGPRRRRRTVCDASTSTEAAVSGPQSRRARSRRVASDQNLLLTTPSDKPVFAAASTGGGKEGVNSGVRLE